MGVKSHFLFSLSRHSKQAGDTRYLPQDVSFFHAMHLPFPDHVHDLISPARVRHAHSNEKKLIPGLTSRLIKRWSCSIRLLRYFTCLSSTLSGRTPAALRSAMALG